MIVGQKLLPGPAAHLTLVVMAEQFSFPQAEAETLSYWNKIDAFQTSLKFSEGRKEFTFYDGPPFATGKPHYGHILAGTIKDVVTRYAHQTGHHVDRRFGWDCHGLPVEYEIDKSHNVGFPWFGTGHACCPNRSNLVLR